MTLTQSRENFEMRATHLKRLAARFGSAEFQEALIEAYVKDTAFLRTDVIKREILTPARLLALPRQIGLGLESRKALGKVAVMVPKNSLGLTLAKAIASSYLMGNETIVRLPSQLKRTTPLYQTLLETELVGIQFAPPGLSGAAFLNQCLTDPEVSAVVIYGDDAWIDAYHPLAKATGTKLLFEGPGNDPQIVMEDADLDAAVEGAIEGGLNNGGQSCSAFERFFVHANVAEAFTRRLIARLSQMKLGSPELASTEIGPIASRVVFDRLMKQIREAVAEGAILRYGGNVIDGLYGKLPTVVPAVLTQCDSEMAVVADETFGPVFPILTFSSLRDLLPPLDDTKYGLNAAVYGTCPLELEAYLESHHRNVYYDSTPVSPENLSTRMVDGGFRRSGFVWEKRESYVTREGRRFLATELSSGRETFSSLPSIFEGHESVTRTVGGH
jgi:acyl-CoA reductase-like NAD-dependent aldehyde dehydrogenase